MSGILLSLEAVVAQVQPCRVMEAVVAVGVVFLMELPRSRVAQYISSRLVSGGVEEQLAQTLDQLGEIHRLRTRHLATEFRQRVEGTEVRILSLAEMVVPAAVAVTIIKLMELL